MESIGNNYINSTLQQLRYYQSVGEKSIDQINDNDIHWHCNDESNSIVTIVKHIAGNSLSRWSDFLTTDGEKQWRNRDDEFEDTIHTKAEMMALWDRGWNCLFTAIELLTETDLLKTVYIRGESHTVIEAINRQLTHLPYHIGQIVFIAKMIADNNWASLTIPKGKSKEFNQMKFSNDGE